MYLEEAQIYFNEASIRNLPVNLNIFEYNPDEDGVKKFVISFLSSLEFVALLKESINKKATEAKNFFNNNTDDILIKTYVKKAK